MVIIINNEDLNNSGTDIDQFVQNLAESLGIEDHDIVLYENKGKTKVIKSAKAKSK